MYIVNKIYIKISCNIKYILICMYIDMSQSNVEFADTVKYLLKNLKLP